VALQGSLDTFALPDVLRLLATTAKTGRLRIDGDRGQGSVWLRDGTVMAATADRAVQDAPAEEVLFELLRFGEGSFAFDMDELSPNGEQPEDVEILLRNARALLKEWNELEAVVPSLDHHVTLVDSLPRGDVTIDSRRWPALVAVAAGRTVRDMASALGVSELAATRAVRDLVDIGVAKVRPSDEPPPPAASRRDVSRDEMARRSPFSSLRSGEQLATSVTSRDGGPGVSTDMHQAAWLQSAERITGSHRAVPDGLASTGNGGRSASGNGSSGATPSASSSASGSGSGELSPRVGRGAGSSGSESTGRRTTPGSSRSSGSSRSTSSRSSSAGRAPSGGRTPSTNRTPGTGKRTGRGATSSGNGVGSIGGRSGAVRDPSGEARRPTPPPSSKGEQPARPGKTRPPSGPRRNGGGPSHPVLPDTGPLSMPPMPTGAFDTGSLGPSPMPPDTGQIRPVSPSALPPDLQWAVDDDGGLGGLGGRGLGVPGNGVRGNGVSGNGVRGNGLSGHGLSSNGLTGHGLPGNGISGNGISGNGAPSYGSPAVGGPPMGGGAPLDPNKVAPHVAAMSPEAQAAVQGTVGNTGGASNALGPGDDLVHRGQLLNFLSSVRS
jgi:Domain of unknown function (DUF4388)